MATPKVIFGVNLSVDDYGDAGEFGKQAELLGYDRVSTGEHIMDGNPPRPTLMSIPAMAAAAGATNTIRVMTGIVIAPLYHPIMLAKMITSLDIVSKGRLDFGIGISGQRGTRVEFDALEIPVNTRGRRTDEILEVLTRLWNEEHVTHNGRDFHFQDVTLLPKPVQSPNPPIWVAGRSEAAMRRAISVGNGWYPYLFTVRRLKSTNDALKVMATEAGRDMTTFHWGLNQPTAISADGESARASAVQNVGQRYVTAERSAEDIAQALCVTGKPEDCIKAVEDRIEAGVREINFGFLADNSNEMFAQMKLFSEKVMPYFKP
jgi:probable F420-dependent oxidoreductase